MVMQYPRHEVAPALQTLMLDYMDGLPWEGEDKPKLLFVYTKHISEVPLPPMVYGDHPRVMVKKMADVFEDSRRRGEMSAAPAELVAVGMLIEFWWLSFDTDEERDHWRRRDFSEHPKAIETRMFIVHQPGHRPVAALENRDRRNTGVKLMYPVPTISDRPFMPGGAGPPLLINLERLARAILQPPATFLSAR